MSALARQQQALLAALWESHTAAAPGLMHTHAGMRTNAAEARGLKAYRSNAVELAQRALAVAYPVLLALLADENFAHLARSLWRHAPPQRGDLAQWGEALPAHIETLEQLAAEPYLADVARAEWALHRLATAPDAAQEASTFARLAQHDPAALTLRLAPAHSVASRYPVASIMTAHLEGVPPIEEAGRRIRESVAETALVWRDGFKPRLRAALGGEAAFIAALQDQASLADALAAAPQFEFEPWLAPAVQGGLLLAVMPA